MKKLTVGTRVMIDNGGAVRVGTIVRYDAIKGVYVIEPDGRQRGDAHLVVRVGSHHMLTPLK